MRPALLLLAAALVACPKSEAPTASSGSVDPATLSLGAPVAAAVAPPPPNPETSATFRGRVVDIAPHVAGFPYRSFHPFPELGVLIYLHEGEGGRTLRALPLKDVPDLDAGRQLNDIDWTKRNIGGLVPLPGEEAVLFRGDEDNKEEFDLYKLFLDDGRVEKITDVPYIYGHAYDAPRDRIAWVARYPVGSDPAKPAYRSCLEWMPALGGAVTTVVCDDTAPFPEGMKLLWTAISFSPDGAWAYVEANHASDRNRMNQLRVRVDAAPVVEVLTEDVTRSTGGVLEDWLDHGRFVYMDNASGYTNVGVGNHGDGSMTPITQHTEDLSDAIVLRAGGTSMVLTVIGRPWESELQLLDAQGKVLAKRTLPENLYALHSDRNVAWFYATSRGNKMRLLKVSVSDYGGFIVSPWFGLPEALAAAVDHCDVERVQIPTFDTDPATGAPRLVHAFWSTPRVPLAEGEAPVAGIVAFYGGGNYWDTQSQILCQAGIASLSPAVRGSWGFGAAYYGLNDGDLGGDEIVDLHAMGRWLQGKGYAPERIGVYGGSHGGYAAMRAMTFPPETNGRDSAFAWGWGVSFFGFSDIKSFYETCNIPDWVLLEAGDPAKDPARIRDRSPLHHVDLLTAPILLLHGENDQRVPVQESRQFAAACAEAGKSCTYVEFAGQGHGLNGIENQVRVYREWFGYLESTLGGAP